MIFCIFVHILVYEARRLRLIFKILRTNKTLTHQNESNMFKLPAFAILGNIDRDQSDRNVIYFY